MSRTMHGDQAVAYRAVIEITFPPDPTADHPEDSKWRDGWTSTNYAGPCGTIGAAKAAITRAKRERGWWWRAKPEVTGYVEKSSIVWERVED